MPGAVRVLSCGAAASKALTQVKDPAFRYDIVKHVFGGMWIAGRLRAKPLGGHDTMIGRDGILLFALNATRDFGKRVSKRLESPLSDH